MTIIIQSFFNSQLNKNFLRMNFPLNREIVNAEGSTDSHCSNVDYFPWIDNLYEVIFGMCPLLFSSPKKVSLQTFVQRGRL